jgi:hypothetical protein
MNLYLTFLRECEYSDFNAKGLSTKSLMNVQFVFLLDNIWLGFGNRFCN